MSQNSPVPPPLPPPLREAEVVKALLEAVATPPELRFARRDTIGRGGAGTVDVLLDRVLQRRVAMKTLIASVKDQPVIARAFLREAQITAQLDHPNLVPVHNVGVDATGRFFFTMKLVEGKTLGELLQDFQSRYVGAPVDAETTDNSGFEQLVDLLDVLVKVCDALAFAHSRGVIHCDLKPQNILVGDFGQVYLMDWGFAQLLPLPSDPDKARRWVKDPLPCLPDAATDGFIFGTPAYMAPEQAKGLTASLDERTDVFSLGALLYTALAGRPPYVSDSTVAVVRLAQRVDFPPLEASPDGAQGLRPRALVRIAERALSAEPEQRYASVAAFKADLVRYLRGGSPFPAIVVPAGTVVVTEGDEADRAFIIASGECEVFKTVDGVKVPLQVLGAGEAFGEMALLTHSPRTATVVTLTRTTLHVINSAVLEEELESMKPWMGALVRSLAGRFRAAQDRLMAAGASPKATGPRAPLGDDEAELWSRFH